MTHDLKSQDRQVQEEDASCPETNGNDVIFQ